MDWKNVVLLWLSIIILNADVITCIRLHKLFQYLEGQRSDYDINGILHVGDQYSVFLKIPDSHSKVLTYELYESRNHDESKLKSKPRVIAVVNVPVEFIKDQLKNFRTELYAAKYLDKNVVPGANLATLKQWQIDKALAGNPDGVPMDNHLRSVLVPHESLI